jgi:hypothetical protein
MFTTTNGGTFGLQREGTNALIDSGSSSKSYAVLTLQMAAGNYAIYVNGVEKGTDTDPNVPAAFNKIGNDFAGEIAEVVAYDRILSTGVREKLEGYLAHKWGLISAFDNSHTQGGQTFIRRHPIHHLSTHTRAASKPKRLFRSEC